MLSPCPRPLLATVVALGALGLAACGSSSSSSSSAQAPNPNAKESSPPGDIPDNQAFVRFTPPGGGYSLKVPEGWAQRTTGGAVVFTDKLNAIRVESRSASSAPTVADVRSGELARLQHAVKGFKPGTVTAVKRTAGPAVRVTYLAAAPRDPVTGRSGTDAVERYLFFHGGHDVVLTLSGPKGADNVDPWRIVTDSVRWSK
jgi:hypothetical protein